MAVEINPTHARMLTYFAYSHLSEQLQRISQPVCDVAMQMAATLANSKDPAEVTVGLRKLLEAKDCFVRAGLNL